MRKTNELNDRRVLKIIRTATIRNDHENRPASLLHDREAEEWRTTRDKARPAMPSNVTMRDVPTRKNPNMCGNAR
ncbi:MAG: hypothetical protein ABIF82_13530 [Planctomycetota bacterium]